MTSFATFPTAMPPHDFDVFGTSNDQYAELMATTTQGYAMPLGFFDSSFGASSTTLDSAPSFQAPVHMPIGEYVPTTHAMHPKQNYSPAASPPQQPFDSVLPVNPSDASEPVASLQSSSSSALGSPASHGQHHALAHAQPQLHQEYWNLGMPQTIVLQEPFGAASLEQDLDKQPSFVDPSLINSYGPSSSFYSGAAFGALAAAASPVGPFIDHPPSPAPSAGSSRSNAFNDSRRFKTSGSQSPYRHPFAHQPYPHNYHGQRRSSLGSIHSRHSQSSHQSGSFDLDDEGAQRGLCPIPECGRVFKDLKAHMLTHQNERPEKCPIVTCEYHVKGFARKYDKNRHTLTHYKGTMVCGFCPGTGSAIEKSFNRADVFKRHLTSVHGVEQTPPNSRKKSPSAGSKKAGDGSRKPGTCSTCGVTFAGVQEFYEHLDECVMRVVQQADPCEAINQKNLGSVADDVHVQETLDRHGLPAGGAEAGEDVEKDEEDEDDEPADGEMDEKPKKGAPKGSRGRS